MIGKVNWTQLFKLNFPIFSTNMLNSFSIDSIIILASVLSDLQMPILKSYLVCLQKYITWKKKIWNNMNEFISNFFLIMYFNWIIM